MRIVKEKIVLQYPAEGTRTSDSQFTDGTYPTVHKDQAGKFVDLDSASGGYPYDTTIERAHDFKTVKKALEYQGHFHYFIVRRVTVTYEVSE